MEPSKDNAEKLLRGWLLQYSLLKWYQFKQRKIAWKQIKRLAHSWSIDLDKYTK